MTIVQWWMKQKRQAVSKLVLRQGTKLEELQVPNESRVSRLSEGALANKLSFVASIRTVIASEMNRFKH